MEAETATKPGAAPSRPRDHVVDAVRVLALACIVVAHSGARGLVFQLRTFDVVCMAFLSGMSYRLAGSRGVEGGVAGYLSYLLRRLRRLVVPTWAFLAIFYGGMGLLHLMGLTGWVGWRMVVRSFYFPNDAGYVWVMRVYLLLALVYPALARMSDALPGNRAFMALVASLLVGCWLLQGVPVAGLPWPLPTLYTDWLLYLVGYGIAAFVGYRHADLGRGERLALALALLAFVLGFSVRKGGVMLHDYKYPPHPYYLCYGIAVSLLLYELLSASCFKRLCASEPVRWVSTNSLWLYLWHIMPATFVAKRLPSVDGWWDVAIRWGMCVLFAVACTMAQNALRREACMRESR